MSITITTQPASVLTKLRTSVTFSVTANSSDDAAILSYQWLKDGVNIDGATSNTYTIASVSPADAALYSVNITCDINADTAASEDAVLASSILDYTELSIKDSILSMSVIGGYNFDWLTVNEADEAIGGYPRALIDSPQEINRDLANGMGSQDYTNDVLFTIIFKCQQENSLNPNFTIRSNLRLAMDDLKQLMGYECSKEGNCLNNSCEEIIYQSSQILYTNKNDILRPAAMKSQWLVRYTQDRLSPTTYAGS